MQKRLRPVYPGDGATVFAIDDGDLLSPDPPTRRWFMQAAQYFGIQLQIAFNCGAAFLPWPPAKLTQGLTAASFKIGVASQLLL
ncbi:hypothetical protein ACAX43_04185 [Paraburkholderia sp. IW21]|uniref:hypothetical protein n=1 Tax=Paraburkholderia sp. IW21 TaxID=3242488 RepID=UPI0035224049